MDNCVFDTVVPARINAVLDWELSTLGDPLADLGLLLLFWRHPGEPPVSSLTPSVTHLAGFPTREEMTRRYAEHSDLDLEGLKFYTAFAHFKFAIVIQGVLARARAGAMGGQTFGDLDDEIRALAQAGLELI
jgi:aminoglycoside phosphotransferase (APT) family kinase protein